MTVEVYQDIKIGSFRFSRSNGVTIKRSCNSIGSTAVIRMPISAVLENKGDRSGLVEVSRTIKVGDTVSITPGYQGKKQKWEQCEFSGFVKKINPTIPLEVECEDNNYLLRKKTINKSWRKTTLAEVVAEIISGTGIKLSGKIPDMGLEPFYLTKVDGAFALQKLADEYGLTVYFKRDGSLYVGLAYTENAGESELIINGENANVIDADRLKFRSAEDVKLKIKAIGFQNNNTKIETELGDDNGALRTLNFYNIKTVDELSKLASQELSKYKFDGYEGSVECFYIPLVDVAYSVTITDDAFPERNGRYFVESVTIDLGENGYRRTIEIGVKL